MKYEVISPMEYMNSLKRLFLMSLIMKYLFFSSDGPDIKDFLNSFYPKAENGGGSDGGPANQATSRRQRRKK